MAVEMQSAIFSLPGKFDKLRFFEENESTESQKKIPSIRTMANSYHQKSDEYTIETITKDDYDRALDFLKKFFFKDEPLNVDIDLLDDDGNCVDLEQFSLDTMLEGISLMAVSYTGKIIGVCLNETLGRRMQIKQHQIDNEKFKKIIRLLDTVDQDADVFGRYPDVETVMNVKVLSVDNSWRGKGIAKKLMDVTRDFAREQGYDLMRVDCTSIFSAKAIARLGFENIFTLRYIDYRVDDQIVFNPKPPHTEMKIYIQRISSRGQN